MTTRPSLADAARAVLERWDEDGRCLDGSDSRLMADLRAAWSASILTAPERPAPTLGDAELTIKAADEILKAWLLEHRMEWHDLPLMIAEDPSSAAHFIIAGFKAARTTAKGEDREDVR